MPAQLIKTFSRVYNDTQGLRRKRNQCLNSIHEFSKIIGVSAQTLRNWDSNGKLHPHHTTTSGYRYYSDEQLNQVMNVKPKTKAELGKTC